MFHNGYRPSASAWRTTPRGGCEVQIRLIGSSAAVVAAILLSLAPSTASGQAARPAGKGKAETAKAGPTPRLPNGKVDFGGNGVWAPIWVQDWADTKYVDKAIDVPFKPEALALFKVRRSNDSKDD